MASPPTPPPLPWAAAASHEQYFVLLTGANSGVGLGIGQRIIDDFLATRSPTSHLILIPTTRSVQKSRDAIRALRAHLETSASARTKANANARKTSNPQAMIDRVHILSVELDLCDLRSVYAAADRLLGRGPSPLRDPTGRVRGGAEVTIPRLDAAIFNAGIGGWKGVNWPLLVRQMLAVGPCQATTFPAFKDALVPAAVLDREKLLGGGGGGGGGGGDGDGAAKEAQSSALPTELAEVFCANVFGHYILAHELMPLLGRPPRGSGSGSGVDDGGSSTVAPGRVIWTSSIDASEDHLDFEDFQARDHQPPYESSKRITDVIALTSELPSVRPVSAPYFSLEPSPSPSPSPAKKEAEWQPPRFYLSHPGIVCTPLFPLGWFLYFWYNLAMYAVRWLGSPWHVVEPYLGAQASAWLALAGQEELDGRAAERVKWGSACLRFSDDQSAGPKETEVEGWGWDGGVGPSAVEEEKVGGEGGEARWLLSRANGRKWDATPLTEERKAKFEDAGRRCWAELEKLRREWEVALGRR